MNIKQLHICGVVPKAGVFALAGLLGFGLAASGESVLFQDTFEDLSQWTGPTNNPEEWEEVERVIEITDLDSEDYFGEAANPYLRLYKNHSERASNTVIANNAFGEGSPVVTVSFDLWDNPDVGGHNGMALNVSSTGITSSRRFHEVNFHNGTVADVVGAYLPGERHRVQLVMNNSVDDVTYLDGEHTVESDTFDVWVGGVKVVGSHTRNRGSHEDLPVGTPLGSIGYAIFTVSQEEILVDNLVVYEGAHIEFTSEPPPFPQPLVEFDFEDESTGNTGLAAGSGDLVNGATFASGVNGGGSLDLQAAGAMGTDAVDPSAAMQYQPGSALNDLLSITITGWFWTEDVFDNDAYLFGKPSTIHLHGIDGQLQFDLRQTDNTPRLLQSTTPWHLEQGKWVFFAVTADLTDEMAFEDNAFMYYAYEDSEEIVLDTVTSLPSGMVRSVSHNSVIGNEHQNFGHDKPFNGLIDKLRIWGSTIDNSAALSAGQIEAIWRQDLGLEEPGGDAPRIVGVAHDGQEFSVSFETEAGMSYVIQYKDDLRDASWTELSQRTGDGEVATVTDVNAGGNRRFYRVLLSN